MTGKAVNLRQARKRKVREEKARQADANSLSHGVSKVDRELSEARSDKSRRDLDGHKRD